MKVLVQLCTFVATILMVQWGPVKAQIDCEGLGALEPCVRPGDDAADGNGTGQFVCRRRFVNGIGVRPRVQSQTLCIAKTWGRSSDRCGCCNGNCPSVCGEVCPNPSEAATEGALGVYVYDWYSYSPRRMCVTAGRSLQLQQQNPSRWVCREYPGWFSRLFGRHYDDYGYYDAWWWWP